MDIAAVIDLEGLVYVADWDEVSSDPDPVPLDKLVANAVSPDMLEDEPQAADLLLRFRQRLLSSLEHVNAAIKSVSKA